MWRLKSQWAKKLKDSGFRDIEHPNGTLKKFHTRLFEGEAWESLEAKQRYFSLALEIGRGYHDEWGNWIDHFLGHEKDRVIWLDHCEGLSEQEITLKRRVHRNTVSNVINKYKKFIIR